MNTKHTFIVLFIVFTAFSGFSQTNSDKIDLKNVKYFYSRLKENKINTKDELVWEYTYGDTSQTKLKALGEVLEKEGLKVAEIKKAKYEPKKYIIMLYEIKQYAPEALNDRMHYLNKIAKANNIMESDALFNAERPEIHENIKSYKPVRN
jgi:hypothetical protein